MNEKSQAFQESCAFWNMRSRSLRPCIRRMRRRKAGLRSGNPENITPSDLEKVICNGIPINKMGNLKKSVSLYPGETFQPEEVQQTENYQYSESQVPGRAV